MPSYTKETIDSTTIKITVTASIGEKIWNNFFKMTDAQKSSAQQQALTKWGVAPNDWYIYRVKTMRQFAPVYECIYKSANRHSFSPEYIHAVVMGEGLHLLLEDLRRSGQKYNAEQSIDAYQYLGADEIGTNIDELINNGYIEARYKTDITPKEVTNELGEKKTSGIIKGFETGIEVVTAELHSRKDWILDYIAKQSLTVNTSDSDTVDFLTYATYNNVSVGMEAAGNISHYMRKYSGTERADQQNVRFNTLKRLSTSDWYKTVKVYDV